MLTAMTHFYIIFKFVSNGLYAYYKSKNIYAVKVPKVDIDTTINYINASVYPISTSCTNSVLRQHTHIQYNPQAFAISLKIFYEVSRKPFCKYTNQKCNRPMKACQSKSNINFPFYALPNISLPGIIM